MFGDERLGTRRRKQNRAEEHSLAAAELTPGMRVATRGPDWRWGNEDGGSGTGGEIISIMTGDTGGWVTVKCACGR